MYIKNVQICVDFLLNLNITNQVKNRSVSIQLDPPLRGELSHIC